MKQFAIIGKTNPYIAQRDIHFDGKSKKVFLTFDTLEEANQELLNWCKEDNQLYGSWNWGLLVSHGYGSSFQDGTKCYSYDSRVYFTECYETEETN